jgi:hypothetical protein
MSYAVLSPAQERTLTSSEFDGFYGATECRKTQHEIVQQNFSSEVVALASVQNRTQTRRHVTAT